MGIVYDRSEIEAQIEQLNTVLTTLTKNLEVLEISTHSFVSEGDTMLRGAYAENIKAFFSEVHLTAIQVLKNLIQGYNHAADQLRQGGDAVDSSLSAHIEESYIKDVLLVQIDEFRKHTDTYYHNVNAAADSVSDIIHTELQRFNENPVIDYEERLQVMIERLKTFNELNVIRPVQDLNVEFNHLMVYMDVCMQGGEIHYTSGNLQTQPFYTALKEKNNAVYVDVTSEKYIEALESLPENGTTEEYEAWLNVNYEKYGDEFITFIFGNQGYSLPMYNNLSKALDVAIRLNKYTKGQKIYRDNSSRIKIGKKFYSKKNGELYRNGEVLLDTTGYDASTAANPIKSGIKATKSSVVNSLDDFKGWKGATKLGKLGKGLGILSFVGTGITIGEDGYKYFGDGSVDDNDVAYFTSDTAVEVGYGLGTTFLTTVITGATVGAGLGPAGIVLGAVAGVAIGLSVNVKFGKPPKSLVERTKSGARKAIKEGSKFVKNTGKYMKTLAKKFW